MGWLLSETLIAVDVREGTQEPWLAPSHVAELMGFLKTARAPEEPGWHQSASDFAWHPEDEPVRCSVPGAIGEVLAPHLLLTHRVLWDGLGRGGFAQFRSSADEFVAAQWYPDAPQEHVDLIALDPAHLIEFLSWIGIDREGLSWEDERLRSAAWPTFQVWRQDDNGHDFAVSTHSTEAQARAVAQGFEDRGHKQLYWVERVDRSASTN